MILLLGGTAETGPAASALARAGFFVLACTATDAPICIDEGPRIRRHIGRLDDTAMRTLARQIGARAIVDVGHPYAERLHRTAESVAASLRLPYVRLSRPPFDGRPPGIRARGHAAAARAACRLGRPIFLTIGSGHLESYLLEAKRTSVPLAARVLDHPVALDACRRAGFSMRFVVTGRGPFSVADNLRHLRRFNAGVLVTKDGGAASGLDAKVAAATTWGCALVIVERPPETRIGSPTVDAMMAAVLLRLRPGVPSSK